MNTIIVIIISLVKKPINPDYFVLAEKVETNSKLPIFKG